MQPTSRFPVVALLLLVCVSPAFSLPQFALRTGARCQSCHMNPTGSGMRSEFGSKQYGRETLPMEMFRDVSAFEDFEPKLSETFSMGMDVRTLFQRLGADHSNSFFEMEGNLYINAQLNKFLSIYLDKGLYQGFQIYGIVRLPENLGLKVGKFLPAAGLRTDDHTAFSRQGVPGVLDLPFGARGEDTGIEAIYSPDHLLFTAGIFNGESGGTGGLATAGFGRKRLASAIRGEYVNRLSDALGISAGASYYSTGDFNGEYSKLGIAGIFGGIDLLKTVTVQAEFDAVAYTPLLSGTATTGRIVYAEANVLVAPGFDLKLQYDFTDPDIDVKSGTYSRIGAGGSIFILSGLELRPEYRITTDLSGRKTRDILTQLHFYL